MWFSPRTAMTKQRLFNWFVGPRGDGKTTGSRNYAIEMWEKYAEKDEPYQIGIIRRRKNEMLETERTFFDTCPRFGFNYQFKKADGHWWTINGDPAFKFFALSTDARIKGAGYDNIKLLIFDEFMVDPTKDRYLPDEVNTFLKLYDTIARPSDPTRGRVPVIFLGNAESINNPYFDFFHITFPMGKNIFMSKTLYAELIQDEEFTSAASSTEFAETIKNTAYAAHSIQNQFIRDNYTFVDPKRDKGEFLFTIFINGRKYGVWVNWKEGTLYICSAYNPNSTFNYIFTREDMQPNVLTSKRFKTTFHGKLVKDCYNGAAIWFDNIKTKQDFMDIARLANL